jgi:hypothetical protein
MATPINKKPTARTLATFLPAKNIGLLFVFQCQIISIVTTAACHSAPAAWMEVGGLRERVFISLLNELERRVSASFVSGVMHPL